MDVTPPRPPGPVAAYPRTAIDDFLADAGTEQSRLEQAIKDARAREHRANLAAEESEATARLLRSSLHELRQELAERQRHAEAHADALVAAAREEAAGILAQARFAARPPAPRPPEPPVHTPPSALNQSGSSPDPGARPSEAPTTPTPVIPPLLVAPAPESHAAMPSGAGSDNGSSAGEGPKTTALGEDVAGSGPGPAAPPPSATNGDHPAAASSDATTIDVTGNGPSRPAGVGFGARLRRRHREPEPAVAPPPDEFLDFLRGALIDDTPLDHSQDTDTELKWRWTH